MRGLAHWAANVDEAWNTPCVQELPPRLPPPLPPLPKLPVLPLSPPQPAEATIAAKINQCAFARIA